MTDQQTLRESLATAYAAGALEPGMQLLVETQAELAPAARWDLACADAMAGALLEHEAAAPLKAGSMEAVFARLAAEPAQETPAAPMRRAARAAGAVIDEVLHLPIAVRELALEAIGRGGWGFAGPGIRALPLPVSGPSKAELLRIEPGWGAPRHSHRGGEYTLVLTGAFSDERGRYGVGDIAVAGPNITHRPHAERGEVCYALAVTEAPLEFTGAMGLLAKVWRH